MTTTTRICLDVLTSARARREEYVGPWLPEPVVDTAALAPDSRTELAEDVSIALLLTLDRLSPLERAAFLLHDVFDFSFSDVANTGAERGCVPAARRPRTRARARRATPRRDRAAGAFGRHRREACAAGSPHSAAASQSNALTQLLGGDVRVVTDGGVRWRRR
jgi:RNA polymerase sigma-70 factor (ECF subfamily)